MTDSPAVVSISPSSGSSFGGTNVTINGLYFIESGNLYYYSLNQYLFVISSCRFGKKVVPAVYASSEQMSCLSPNRADLPDVVTVEITLNGQQYTSNSILWRFTGNHCAIC